MILVVLDSSMGKKCDPSKLGSNGCIFKKTFSSLKILNIICVEMTTHVEAFSN